MNKPADTPIRENALDPHVSFIVQAPAGSGKTAVLIQRILVLLARVERLPEECLALTFTRKAAIEMRDRVLEALELALKQETPPQEPYAQQTWRLAREVLKRDQKEGWNLLENPSRLKIQTLDALCASITKQMPMIAGFGVTPEIATDPMPLYLKAAGNLIESLESKDLQDKEIQTDLENLLTHLDNHLEGAQRLLAEMLVFREQWLPSIGLSLPPHVIRSALEKGLQTAVLDALNTVVKNIPVGFEQILSLAQFAAEQLLSIKSESAIIECRALSSQWPGKTLLDLPCWRGLAELLLTEKNTFRKTLTQQQGFPASSTFRQSQDKQFYQAKKQEMLELLQRLENEAPAFQEALQSLRGSPPITYSEGEWEVLVCLINLLPLLVAHLQLVFQQEGQVDFAEVAIAARHALGELEAPSDLALWYDYKIRHILVDEFQDISIPQLQLLLQLTAGWQEGDGRTLFLVGDPQQSIYRFRQAEVGLFLQVKEKGLGGLRLKSLTLTSNFRSHPDLVHWINETFSKLFPKQDNILNGMIAFSPSVAARPSSENAAEVVCQTVALETESEACLSIIQKVQQQDPQGSIALLVRSRNQLHYLLPALKQASISFQGVEIERLAQQPLLQDVVSLSRALVHLGDRVAWLSLLRSPWVGLTLPDLWLIANYEPQLPIWSTLQFIDKLEGLSIVGQSRLLSVVTLLRIALMNQARYPIARWIREVLYSLADPAAWTLDEQQQINSFFSLLEKEGYSSDFYNRHLLTKRLESLYAKPMVEHKNAIQIMTIHKSKGLEFDTVILAGLERRQKADSNKLLLWESRASFSREPYFLLAPIKSTATPESYPTYTYLKRENAKRNQFEETRLLYVASTRARKRLYWLTHGREAVLAAETEE